MGSKSTDVLRDIADVIRPLPTTKKERQAVMRQASK